MSLPPLECRSLEYHFIFLQQEDGIAMKLLENTRFTLDIPAPFYFALTVAKPAGWHSSIRNEIFEDGTLWTGIYTRGRHRSDSTSARKKYRPATDTAYSESPLSPARPEELKIDPGRGARCRRGSGRVLQIREKGPGPKKTVGDLPVRAGRVDDLFGAPSSQSFSTANCTSQESSRMS